MLPLSLISGVAGTYGTLSLAQQVAWNSYEDSSTTDVQDKNYLVREIEYRWVFKNVGYNIQGTNIKDDQDALQF